MTSVSISFLCHDARWKTLLTRERALFRRLAKKAIAQRELPDKKYALAVVLTDDDTVQTLNRDFRHKDKPTNVLSFPMLEDFKNLKKIPEPIELGDVILALETIKKEAADNKKTLRAHTAHLIVHGCLHLIGYDHLNKKAQAEMESLEIAILQSAKIKSPY